MEISLPERERSTTDLLYSVFTENTWDTNHLLYVTRITELHGFEHLLSLYAQTSGTTGNPKYIPLLESSVLQYITAQQAFSYELYAAIPGIYGAKIKANRDDILHTTAQARNTEIILDESFLRKEQFEHIQDRPGTWIVNIRISNSGGILRSLDIVQEAQRVNIPVIIGAQVGETGILTRSALTVANTHCDILLAQ